MAALTTTTARKIATKISSEKFSTPSVLLTTPPQQNTHLIKQRCPSKGVSVFKIKVIAAKVFDEKGRGITFYDVCKGKYKVVETLQQARNLLKYHKKKGNLYSNTLITIPQQYYATQEQAQTAASIQEYRNRTLFTHPTGVSHSKHYTPTKYIQQQDIDNLKAENFNQVMEYYHNTIALKKPAIDIVRVGIHKILIHLQVYKGREQEAYEDRLYDVPPDLRNNQAKTLETLIEISGNSYHVKASVFPNGKIIVDVPCSENHFPIWLQDSEKIKNNNNDLLRLFVNIRAFLQDKMRDYHSRIIPPTHNPVWRFKNCDINFDIPTTALNFYCFPNMQVKQFHDAVVTRIYAKMLQGQTYVRVEQACKNFDTPIVEVDVAEKLRRGDYYQYEEEQQEKEEDS